MEACNVTDHLVKDDWFPSGKEWSRKLLRRVVPLIRRAVSAETSPSVTEIARTSRSPFRILVSTVISARTKDEVTTEASSRLFARAASPADIASMTERSIEKLIFPAGFYRTKARAILALAKKIDSDFGGRVPDTIDELLMLPGVGRKTANLVVTHGFGKPGICVDTHVHRFVNRLGAVRTRHPQETEFALRAVLLKRYWIEINELLVTYGKNICTPVSPYCSRCTVRKQCARFGVGRSR
jgi:endonuclease-3